VFAITPESVFDFDRNSCSICSGMSVRFGPEFTLGNHDKEGDSG
jgi:hypothetical protein